MPNNNLNKPNVAVVTHAFSSKLGEIFSSSLIKIIEPSVNEIFVISGNFKPEGLLSNEKIHLRNVKPVKEEQPWPIKFLKYVPAQLEMCANLAKISSNIDIVIFAQGGTWLILPLLCAKLLRKKVILDVMASTPRIIAKTYGKALFGKGGFIFSNVFRVLTKISYALSDKIVILTEGLLQYFELDQYKSKVSVSIDYYLTDIFRMKKGFYQRKKIVGYVGRLSQEKGVLEFSKAISLILSKKKDIRFLIVGDGMMRAEMEKELERAGSLDKVDFVGEVPHEKVPNYYNEMRFYIFPSHSEVGGGAHIEAAACGAIVIANPVGGIPDLVLDNETGFLLKDNSPRTIADKVIEVWDSPNLESIQHKAKVFTEENFSYSKVVERWGRILRSL